jgi:hypothetical protein
LAQTDSPFGQLLDLDLDLDIGLGLELELELERLDSRMPMIA